MASTSNGSPFMPFTLSHDDAACLKRLVGVLVGHQVESYEKYLLQDLERLDSQRWKLVQQRDNVRVFSELQRDANPSHPEDDLDSTDTPRMLVTGQMEGSLDDAMYGVMTPTLASMRLKYFYTNDMLANGAVLDTIEMPSEEDPFESLTVKWVEGYRPPVLGTVVKNRDFVYMEATGFSKLSDGEVVGYHLMHSVHFPQTPEVHGNIRATISTCELYRQRNHSAVEVFGENSFTPGGNLPRSLAIKYGAVALSSVRKLVRCAHHKKLAWLLQVRDPGPNSSVICGEAKCIGCGHKPGFFVNGIGACSLCRRALCSNCRLKIELGFIGSMDEFVRRKLWFCSYCSSDATRTDPRLVVCSEYTDSRVMLPTPWGSFPHQHKFSNELGAQRRLELAGCQELSQPPAIKVCQTNQSLK